MSNILYIISLIFYLQSLIFCSFVPFNDTYRIDSTSDLIYVISLLNNGVTLPDTNLLGSFVKPTNDNNNQNTNTDPWLQQWKSQDVLFTAKSISTATSVADQISALYFNTGNTGYNFLNLTQKNSISFIATNEVSQSYLNNLISRLYNISQVLPESYSFTNYLNGDFTYLSSSSSFKYGYFSSSDAMYNYGFQYNQCQKNINWKNYASTLPKNLQYYQKTFLNLFNSFEYYASQSNMLKNKITSQQTPISNLFYSQQTNKAFLNITSSNLSTNITQMEILVKNYIADYSINPDQMNKNFTSININDVNNLLRFINYDINTFSMLHNFIAVQPLLKVIETLFDDQITGNSVESNPKGAKALFFTTNDYIFTTLY